MLKHPGTQTPGGHQTGATRHDRDEDGVQDLLEGGIADVVTQLLDADDNATLQQALNQWRRVAARSRPRSPRWFRAKYSIALAQHKLGDNVGAAKLIRYLQATEDLQANGWHAQFQQLLERCEP